jgi:hypothetical protein
LSIRSASISSHVEDNVLQAGGLCDLPVDTSTSPDRHRGSVDNEVTNLTEKVVLIEVSANVSAVIKRISDMLRTWLVYQLAPPGR